MKKNLSAPARWGRRGHPRGFALVVTLSLMILLTVIAVGLLSLSGISLRAVSHGDAMQTARANARLSLMLALGDLQKQLGPDTRISAPADQVAGSDPSTSGTPQAQRQWTGAYNSWSWPDGAPESARPQPTFLQWFVSGDPTAIEARDYAGTAIGTDPKNSVEIVSANTVGPDADPVRVPLITRSASSGLKDRLGWWVGDLGTKGLISKAADAPTALGEVRADQQSIASFNLKGATSGSAKPFAQLAGTDLKLANVVSLQTAGLLAEKPDKTRGFFHDFTAWNRGLLTNVRKGGFRKDLSMELERTPANQPSLSKPENTLYKVNGETGINLQELWAYYSICSNTKGLKRSGTAAFTTGGTMSSGTPYLQLEPLGTAQQDDWFALKQPVIINYQLALSLQTTGTKLVYAADPIITMWNPLDVPLVVPSGQVFTVKYWSIPYTLRITKNGASGDYPLSAASADGNFLSLELGSKGQQIVFKPGEVIRFSQTGGNLAASALGDVHALAASKGFNYGNGAQYDVKATPTSGTFTCAATDKIKLVSAVPNIYTAGASGSDGAVVSGGTTHTRHFSLTHHEFYYGKDREPSGSAYGNTSLGIGGIYLDYDFGNKRLKFSDAMRVEGTPGTKSSSDRYNATQRKDVFKEFTIGRDVPMTGTKMPFMLLSFNVKTEAGSTRGSRSLARFNPKALQVDFYSLQPNLSGMRPADLDMLPYEYNVEILSSWKSQTQNLDTNSTGQAFFGGGLSGGDGVTNVVTHSIPREPIVSLASFQYSFANGFDTQKPRTGYSTLNAREPMLPQIAHAIGNSLACPMLPKNQVTGTLAAGGRPLADHSYLANQTLWDDWFLSGIAPQNSGSFSKSRVQKLVASDFFTGAGKLPTAAYLPNLMGKDPNQLGSLYFSTASPPATATTNIASLISVNGMFNVNSTSVEAWKSLLGGRKDRPVVSRSDAGKESIESTGSDKTPVSGLISPVQGRIAEGSGNVALNDPAQWVGRRVLSDDQIDKLARNIVKEVRKRGPFLSLADFINRRVGNDADLARAGAIQNALDAADSKINDAYQGGGRGTTDGSRFNFPDAENGAISQGAPGIVKQADILTPIAPILSARSDTFLIRGYGEKTDASGKIIARAWCEAVVTRSASFIDPKDPVEKPYASISPLNKTFGRRFEIVSFRWLNSTEA